MYNTSRREVFNERYYWEVFDYKYLFLEGTWLRPLTLLVSNRIISIFSGTKNYRNNQSTDFRKKYSKYTVKRDFQFPYI